MKRIGFTDVGIVLRTTLTCIILFITIEAIGGNSYSANRYIYFYDDDGYVNSTYPYLFLYMWYDGGNDFYTMNSKGNGVYESQYSSFGYNGFLFVSKKYNTKDFNNKNKQSGDMFRNVNAVDNACYYPKSNTWSWAPVWSYSIKKSSKTTSYGGAGSSSSNPYHVKSGKVYVERNSVSNQSGTGVGYQWKSISIWSDIKKDDIEDDFDISAGGEVTVESKAYSEYNNSFCAVACPSSNKLYFKADVYNVHVYAYYQSGGSYTKGTTGGTVQINSESTGSDKNADVYGSVTVTAAAASGYTFKGWYANSSGSGSATSTSAAYSFTISATTTLYALFDVECNTPSSTDIDIKVPASATTIYLGTGSAPFVTQTVTATCSTGNTYLWESNRTGYSYSGAWGSSTSTNVAFTSSSSKNTTATFYHEGVYTATFKAGCSNTTDASKDAPTITVKPGYMYFGGPLFDGGDNWNYPDSRRVAINTSTNKFIYEWTAAYTSGEFIASVGNVCGGLESSAYTIGNYAEITKTGVNMATSGNHNFSPNIGTINVGDRLKLTVSYTGVNSSGQPKYTVKLEKVCSNPTAQTVSGTATICSGSSTNVTVASSQSNYTYKLYKDGSATATTIAGTDSELNFSVSEAGTYTVHAYYTSGSDAYCKADMSGSATVSVNATSNAGSIADATACSGIDTQLQVTGITGSVTKWKKKGASDANWSDIENSASSQITVAPTVNTSYKAVVKNGVCDAVETETPGVITVNYGSIARSGNESTTFDAQYLDAAGTARSFAYTISCGATNFRASVTAGSDDYSVGDLSVAGSTLTVPVTFRPSTHGTRNGTVTITYDKTNSTTGTATLSLTGTGKTLYLVGSAFVSGDAAWSTFNPMSYDRTAGKYHYRSESPNFGTGDDHAYKILLSAEWGDPSESMYKDANWTFSKTGMDNNCVIGTYNNGRSNSIIGNLSSGYVAPVDVYVTANTTTIANAKTLEVKAKRNCAEPSAKTVSASSPACNGGTVTITTASAESGFTYQLYVDGVADPEQIIESTSTSGLEFEVTASVAADADVTYSIWGRKTDNVLCDWVEVGSVDVSVKYPDIAVTGIGAKSNNATYPWEYITLTATTNCSTVTWDDAVFVGGSAPAYSESKNAKTYMLKSAITARPDDDYYLIGVSGSYGGCNAETEYKIYINQAPAEPSCN